MQNAESNHTFHEQTSWTGLCPAWHLQMPPTSGLFSTTQFCCTTKTVSPNPHFQQPTYAAVNADNTIDSTLTMYLCAQRNLLKLSYLIYSPFVDKVRSFDFTLEP
jgi:hypothetical protein